jgi:transposase
MMGERRVMQEALFYGFSLERHVPDDHLLRKIDRFVDLSEVRAHLEPYYSDVGRPSIDPELMVRMLIVGYCLGIRSERRLCEEVHLNLAYRELQLTPHSPHSETLRLSLSGMGGGRPKSLYESKRALRASSLCARR